MSNPYDPPGGPPAPISLLRTISDNDIRSHSARSTSQKSTGFPGNDIEEGTGESSAGNEDTLSDLKPSSKSAQEGTYTNTSTNTDTNTDTS
jgi:hypothetical protein